MDRNSVARKQFISNTKALQKTYILSSENEQSYTLIKQGMLMSDPLNAAGVQNLELLKILTCKDRTRSWLPPPFSVRCCDLREDRANALRHARQLRVKNC